jgi:putative nucleotidyltransferase with HDIG domain
LFAKASFKGLLRNASATIEERLVLQAAECLTRATIAVDPYTGAHLRAVGQLAKAIAANMGLDDKAQRNAYLGGLLHDVGKIGIDRALLTAARRLLPEELAIIKRHPEIGAQIVEQLDLGLDIRNAVEFHHERWDGNGYPAGLKGAQIPLNARIVAAADAAHAMLGGRAYRPAREAATVIRELRNGSGSQWDPAAVAAVIPLIDPAELAA